MHNNSTAIKSGHSFVPTAPPHLPQPDNIDTEMPDWNLPSSLMPAQRVPTDQPCQEMRTVPLLTRLAESAISYVRPDNSQHLDALKNLVKDCLTQKEFDTHPWKSPDRISDKDSLFLQSLAQNIAAKSHMVTENQASSQTPETILKSAAQEAFKSLGASFSLDKPFSFFVFDTETNRLFGDISTIGWIRFDIKDSQSITVECKNCVLPPGFMNYGAERVHQLSLDWIKEQHKQGLTVSREEAALEWLTHAIESKSIIGFNVLYDLNAIKKLFHETGLESDKVDQLFSQLSTHYALDAQDYLLRIDPLTRHQHNLPFADTKGSREIAKDEFENVYPDCTPIAFMPNKKLVSYAEGFLGMKTEGAHDALFDCVLTAAGFIYSMALRNETLDNEATLKPLPTNLMSYNREIKTADPRVRLFNKTIPFNATDSALLQNPFLKTTPFIFKTLGPSVHRRHIIPKSQLASLVSFQGDTHKQNQLFKALLNHPLFPEIASERLSPEAITICQSVKSTFNADTEISSEYPDKKLLKAVIDLLKGFEFAKQNDIPLRYFERGLAADMIQALPSIDSFQNAQAVQEHDLNKILSALLYSFFHSLEFNQFIGEGADNLLAGQVFHDLETREKQTLNDIHQARDSETVHKVLSDWLHRLSASLSLSIPSTQSQATLDHDGDVIMTESEYHQNEIITEGESMLYSLEKSHSASQFLSAFFSSTLKTSDSLDLSSQKTSLMEKNESLNRLRLLQNVAHHKSGTATTFKDQKAFSSIDFHIEKLESALHKKEIDEALKRFYKDMPNLLQALDQSNLYSKDKVLLNSLMNRLFSQLEIKRELLQTIQAFEPSDTSLNPLDILKKSTGSFVKSIADSTTIDLPQNASSGLQNAYLLPLLANIQGKENPSVEEVTNFFTGLMEADHAIADQLHITRVVNPKAPLHANYMDYLY